MNKLLSFGKMIGVKKGARFSGVNVTDTAEHLEVLVKDNVELVREVVDSYVSKGVKYKWIHEVDYLLLRKMKELCDNTKYMEERVDWYDDEEDPNHCTWSDIEGEYYGWLWMKNEDNPELVHKELTDRVALFIESTKKDIKDGEVIYVIILEMNGEILYHFIGRPRLNADVIYTFSNEEIDF